MKIYELIYNEKNNVYDERLLEPIREQRIIPIENPLLKYPWEFIPLPEYVTNIYESNITKSKTRKCIENSFLVKVCKLVFNMISLIIPFNFISNYFNVRNERKEKIKYYKKIGVACELNLELELKYKNIICYIKTIHNNNKLHESEKMRLYNSFFTNYIATHNSMIRSYHRQIQLIDIL